MVKQLLHEPQGQVYFILSSYLYYKAAKDFLDSAKQFTARTLTAYKDMLMVTENIENWEAWAGLHHSHWRLWTQELLYSSTKLPVISLGGL